MSENDKKENLNETAAEVSAQASQLLENATRQTAPTLATNATASDVRPQPAAHDPRKRRGRGRPRVIRDPLILAKIGEDLSIPRKISGEKNGAHDAADTPHPVPDPAGGIPPESTGAGKIFGNESVGASQSSHKKNSKKIIEKVTVNQQPPSLSPDTLLRLRLTSGIRDAKLRQLFELMIQNPTLPMHEAMRVLGYSQNTSQARIVKNKTWQMLVRTMITDEEIKERERFLLFHENPKWVNASLDRIHKIAGSFQHVQTNVNVNIDGEVRQMSDQALYDIIDGEVVQQDEAAGIDPVGGDSQSDTTAGSREEEQTQ
jgi:hypothetical protein